VIRQKTRSFPPVPHPGNLIIAMKVTTYALKLMKPLLKQKRPSGCRKCKLHSNFIKSSSNPNDQRLSSPPQNPEVNQIGQRFFEEISLT